MMRDDSCNDYYDDDDDDADDGRVYVLVGCCLNAGESLNMFFSELTFL